MTQWAYILIVLLPIVVSYLLYAWSMIKLEKTGKYRGLGGLFLGFCASTCLVVVYLATGIITLL